MSESDSQLRIQYVDTPERLNDLDFEDDLAVIEVPANSLRNMPFDVDTAVNEDDFKVELRRTRWHGHDESKAIALHPLAGGRWIVDHSDAARFLAAKRVVDEVLPNLFFSKVNTVRFTLRGTSDDGSYAVPRHRFREAPF